MLPGISPLNQSLFASRYIPLFKSYRTRSRYYAIIFHSSRFVVTVGSITVPALLSLQNTDNIKWLTWAISLAVTIFNGILTLFSIDRKYYYLHTVRGVLESEAYQFLALAGRYGKAKETETQNSHAYQFPYFCIAMEKIRMKQIEEEYFKPDNADKNKEQPPPIQHTSVTVQSQKGETASNPTPVKQEEDELGAPIGFSRPFFRSKAPSATPSNDIEHPWTCQNKNCRHVNKPTDFNCAECNMEHPTLADSPIWFCPKCNGKNLKTVHKCQHCIQENP